jgi:hypothetical protein
MSTATISISDVVAIPALCVAVLAIVLVPLVRRQSEARAQTDELARKLRAVEDRLAALAGVTARGFASTYSTLDFVHGLAERLRQERLAELNADEVEARLSDLQRGVERAWAEANLLTNDEAARTSALEQLNGRLGNAHSAEVTTHMSTPEPSDQ